MGGRKTGKRSSQAPGQFYGYSIQTTRMLARLLSCHAGQAVSLEVVDDVAVEGPRGTTAEQTKSGLAHNPISDRAVDLWKTLFNWVEAIRAGALSSDTRFVLYVAQPYEGELVHQLDQAATRLDAVSIVKGLRDEFWGKGPQYEKRTSLPETIAPFVNGVLETSDDVLIHLVVRFSLETGSGSPSDDLRPLLREKAISEGAVESVLQYLLGWVKQTVEKLIERGGPAVITWEEFIKKLVAAAKKFDRSDVLQPAATEVTEAEVDRELRNRIYIRQLQLIESDERELVQAVNDYLRAAADRTSWSERGDILEPSFKEFEEELRRMWATRRRLVQVELAGRSEVDIGRVILARSMELRARLQGMDVPFHFTPGSYHSLADVLTLGWHPRYDALLVATNAQPEANDPLAGS